MGENTFGTCHSDVRDLTGNDVCNTWLTNWFPFLDSLEYLAGLNYNMFDVSRHLDSVWSHNVSEKLNPDVDCGADMWIETFHLFFSLEIQLLQTFSICLTSVIGQIVMAFRTHLNHFFFTILKVKNLGVVLKNTKIGFSQSQL